MPFRIALRDQVVYVSWRGFTQDDLREVSQRIAERRRTFGRNLVYLARIPGGGGTFTDEQTAMLLDFLLSILPCCATVHHVIEGDGFLKGARRAILANLARATPRPRDFYAHETIDAALAALRTIHGIAIADLGTTHSPPASEERASSAFRAATRIIEGHRSRKA